MRVKLVGFLFLLVENWRLMNPVGFISKLMVVTRRACSVNLGIVTVGSAVLLMSGQDQSIRLD